MAGEVLDEAADILRLRDGGTTDEQAGDEGQETGTRECGGGHEDARVHRCLRIYRNGVAECVKKVPHLPGKAHGCLEQLPCTETQRDKAFGQLLRPLEIELARAFLRAGHGWQKVVAVSDERILAISRLAEDASEDHRTLEGSINELKAAGEGAIGGIESCDLPFC